MAQKQNLRLNLSKGETYTNNLITNVSLVENIDGKDLVITLKSDCKINYKVTDIQHSVYTMEASYAKLSMKMGIRDKEQEFTSDDDDPADVFSLVLKELINKPFLVSMTTMGRITEVKNVDSLFTHALNNIPRLSEEQKQQMLTQLNQSYGAKYVASNMQLGTAVFPGSAVTKGDSWFIKSTMESSMSMNIETTYQLKETGDTYNILSGIGRVKNVGNDTYIKSGSSLIKYNAEGSIASNIKIDKKSGWILVGKITIDVSGTAHIKETTDLPAGMDIPMKIVSATEMTGK